MKKIILLFVLFNCLSLFSQEQINPVIYSPDGVLENVLDNYGNVYKLSDILIDNNINGGSSSQRGVLFSCPNSIFELYLEDGCGMELMTDSQHIERRAVVCKFFQDLSSFITTPTSPIVVSGNKVKIWVRNITNVGVPNTVLGLASPFYNLPVSGGIGGIVDNEIWKTIHTGIDSYANVAYPIQATNPDATPYFYHGMIAFRFNNTNWNTSLSLPASSNQYDLYTVLLHEMTHALGFTSLINKDGQSVLGNSLWRYYSRYDQFLRTNNTITPLITAPNVTFPMYNNGFNTTLNLSVLRPNCILPDNHNLNESIDATLCNDALQYRSAITVPIYTPTCFENGSSFSHFEDSCIAPFANNQYFVMSNANGIGVSKRYLKPQERIALCDIGYQVNSTFGTNDTANGFYDYGTGSSCAGINVAGVNDGIASNNTFTFAGVAGSNIPISSTVLLGNDRNAISFEGLVDFYGTGTINGSTNPISGNTGTLQFNSNTLGVHLLRYVPVGVGGVRGNITYVYVFVFPATSTCQVNPCNLVVNGDFEQSTSLPTSFGDINKACGWNETNSASPDYYHLNSVTQNLSPPCTFFGIQASNNGQGLAYVGMSNRTQTNGFKFNESIYSKLSTPLSANTNYQLSFDVSLAEGSSSFVNKLQAYLSVNPVAVFGSGDIPIANPTMLFTNPTFSTNFNGWETITFNFMTTTGGEQYIYLGGLNNVEIHDSTAALVDPSCGYFDNNSPSNAQNRSAYYYLDNVKLVPLNGATFNLPSIVCIGNNLSNLTTYLSSVPTTGVFTGQGVTLNAGIYSFNSTTAQVGLHIINYTYLNSSNCSITISKTIEVSSCLSDLQIVKSINSLMPAVGSNVTFTLTATNNGPSNATGVVVTDVIPSGYTIQSATTSVGSWSAPNWTIGNLANGATVTMTIMATVNSSGSFTNRATITGNQTDPFPKNNSSSVSPKVIYAAPDTFSINSCMGGTTSSVLSNDMVSGSLVSPANVTITLLNTNVLPGAIINANGTISVPAGTSPNSYQIPYRICQTATGYMTNCSQAIAIVVVGYDPIIAIDDDFSVTNPINTLTGGTTPSILSNDTLNNVAATSSNVTILYDVSDPEILPPPTINVDGTIELPQGLTIDDYTIYYTISENGCPENMSSASVKIIVNEQVIVTPQIVSGTRANSIVEDVDIQVDSQGNGKIIISGQFTTYNNVPCNKIARLNSNLTLDTTTNFQVSGPIPALYNANDMKVIKNMGDNYNKILLVGLFDGFSGGSNGKSIVRLMPDGTLDTSFNANYFGSDKGVSGSNSQIYCCYVYPDGSGDNTGKILIGGMFNAYNGEPRYKIARLNVDGSLDYTFNPNIFNDDELYFGPGFNSAVMKIVVQPVDQKIIVGGYFQRFNGVLVNGIARLNDDGTIDSTFNNGNISSSRGITKTPPRPANYGVHIEDIVLQDNGSIIIGGQFEKYNNVIRNGIARLTPTGALDTFFAVNTGFNTTLNPITDTYGMVRDLDLEGTGVTTKVYVSGDFTSYQGVACHEIIKLNNSGFLDVSPSFNLSGGGPNGSSNGPVWCMKRQNDGKMIIGGMFTTYAIIPALNVTRIFPSPNSLEAKNGTDYYDSEPDAIDLATLDGKIFIYPNPSNGEIKFATGNFKNKLFSIKIYNVMGQKVFERIGLTEIDDTLNLNDFRQGTYFVTFVNEIETITKTIIIE
ncbi:T9SS type A sorting domain-containing protein [Flavobacterium sp. RSB2_4_14]|uniref:T9SS type A sorting domain-containing protein n=1 Tax=Flavobacterium sp. RSB2_4_14 TaxID=3447665 RepID=UPI003F3F8B2D